MELQTLRERVEELVYDVIDETNSQLPIEMHIIKSINTELTGIKKRIDSLGLVLFIAALESRIHREFNRIVTLADEQAIMHHENPLKTVGTLIEYIAHCLSMRNILSINKIEKR